jgi:hypothetical protein
VKAGDSLKLGCLISRMGENILGLFKADSQVKNLRCLVLGNAILNQLMGVCACNNNNLKNSGFERTVELIDKSTI